MDSQVARLPPEVFLVLGFDTFEPQVLISDDYLRAEVAIMHLARVLSILRVRRESKVLEDAVDEELVNKRPRIVQVLEEIGIFETFLELAD